MGGATNSPESDGKRGKSDGKAKAKIPFRLHHQQQRASLIMNCDEVDELANKYEL
jgi:hypothetical protein